MILLLTCLVAIYGGGFLFALWYGMFVYSHEMTRFSPLSAAAIFVASACWPALFMWACVQTRDF